MAKYAVLYAKITDDKDVGILLSGIYFGGVANSMEEADAIAESCVAETQGGMIIPKIMRMDVDDLRTAIKEMESRFDQMADEMYENERILGRQDRRH